MKHRFETQKGNSSTKNFMISIICFFLVISLFSLGTSFVSGRTSRQELVTLKAAVNRGIVHCYSIEGVYPESLEYLKENYGLIYDEDRFFVDYHVSGSNILPDVTIIDRKGDRQ